MENVTEAIDFIVGDDGSWYIVNEPEDLADLKVYAGPFADYRSLWAWWLQNEQHIMDDTVIGPNPDCLEYDTNYPKLKLVVDNTKSVDNEI